MKTETKNSILVSAIIVVALVLDQALKLYVRTHFELGESRVILPFFHLCFIENNGMAFGMEWGSKIFLTLFRIVAVGLLSWYMHRLINGRRQTENGADRPAVRTGYLVTVSLIMAGALGNIIDCVFYGKLFGYADWLYGKVVDMLYFPLIVNRAGECIFFRPVFNLADSCITVAVIVILIWYRKDLDDSLKKQ